MRTKTVNRSYRELGRLGKNNRSNRFRVYTTQNSEIGVAAITEGNKRATTVRLLVPGRSARGSKKAISLILSGAQARALFNTLATHYAERQ